MKKVGVLLNEQHQLLPDQERVLNKEFGGDWEIVSLPKDGLSLAEMESKIQELRQDYYTLIFASCPPAMQAMCINYMFPYKVFHNDRREKKELPNGRIIMAVARDGWQLVDGLTKDHVTALYHGL